MVSYLFACLVDNGIGIGNETFIEKNTLAHEPITNSLDGDGDRDRDIEMLYPSHPFFTPYLTLAIHSFPFPYPTPYIPISKRHLRNKDAKLEMH